jgi:hypothetical protein
LDPPGTDEVGEVASRGAIVEEVPTERGEPDLDRIAGAEGIVPAMAPVAAEFADVVRGSEMIPAKDEATAEVVGADHVLGRVPIPSGEFRVEAAVGGAVGAVEEATRRRCDSTQVEDSGS